MITNLIALIIGLALVIAVLSSPIFWLIAAIGIIFSIFKHFKKKKDEEIIFEILENVFTDGDMNDRLNEFILQHTKRYDNGQIYHNDYLDKIDMFLNYIHNKIGSDLENNAHRYVENNSSYSFRRKKLTINRENMEKFIDSRKLRIYSEEMKDLLDIDNSFNLDETIKKYIELLGENGLRENNIEILSRALDEDDKYISGLVKDEYARAKKEYEMRKLESELFASSASMKDMDYIDKLSGFEFEDFLEDLFIELGYKTKDLPYSNDYGADLIISKGFNEIVIQAKNYTSNVGNTAVQEVIAAKSYYKSDIAMVITNSYYTENAIKTAEASEIILVDRDGLQRIINEGNIYFTSLLS